ncbi:transposase [Anaerostipes caccae]|uniref:transposase n=1 Tax=Anaerostipes caccae TaxID=105841 RepID=UPI0038D3F240
MGKSYTEEFKEMVVRDRVQNGLSVIEASKKYGVAHGTVCLWTDQYGFLMEDAPRRSEERKNKAVQEYLNGREKKDILADYNISGRTLCRWVREHWREQEEERVQDEQPKSIFKERRRTVNGKKLRVVYPTSSSAYVTWAK